MSIPEKFGIAMIVAILSYFAFRFFKYGGYRGAVYGSSVARTVGDLTIHPSVGVSTKLRVHVLEDRRIVLELSSRAFLSYSLEGFPMTIHDADQLVGLLQQAKL